MGLATIAVRLTARSNITFPHFRTGPHKGTLRGTLTADRSFIRMTYLFEQAKRLRFPALCLR
jgi:hypothetical protein